MEWFDVDSLNLLAVNFALIISLVLALWLASIPLRDVSIIDMAFAVILFLVALSSYVQTDGVDDRKLLIVSLVGIWATRITIHLVKRNWGHGEDVRYSKLRSWVDDDRAFIWLSLKKVFLLQGVVLWLVSLPIQLAQFYDSPAQVGWLGMLGAIICVAGIIYESVADMQLTRFRNNAENKGQVLNTGLWRYSRHPNYFGELCVWWGLFIIACENPLGWITIIGPLAYTYLIVNVTGQATLDKKMAREKPAYKAYMESTNGMIPMPPRTNS